MSSFTDSLQNFITNLGTRRDKSTANFFSMQIISPVELLNIYKQGGIGGKVIDCVAEDLCRVWRTVSIPDVDVDEFNTFQSNLNVEAKLVEQIRWSRLYGAAVIILEVEGDDLEEELLDATISPSKPITGLRVEHRHDLVTEETNLVTGRPATYEVRRTGEKIHLSRIIGPMDGIPVPVEEMRTNGGWGESVLGRVYNSLMSEASVALGINSIMSEAKVDVVSVNGLSTYLNGGTQQVEFEKRWALWAQLKSILNVALIDADNEAFETKSNAETLVGMAPLLERLANRISAETDIPMTRLYGSLASGLSTSGATNQQDYYDMLTAVRKFKIVPELKTIDKLSCLSVYGRVPDGFAYKWKPFRELSRKERAEVELIQSTTAKTNIEVGAVVPGHVARNLKEFGTYQVSEDFVEFLEKRDGINEGSKPDEEGVVPGFGEENEGNENEARILIEMAIAVKAGTIEAEQAKAIIMTSFPDLPPEDVQRIITAEVNPPVNPPAFALPGESEEPPEEE